MTYFAGHSVHSISAVCDDKEMERMIDLGDRIRSETLDRCYSIRGYQYKSLKWKNRYYDHFRKIVEAELMK